MGAEQFINTVTAQTAEEAFSQAVEGARYEYGHGGYTGTIAEKSAFELFAIPEGMEVRQVIDFALSGDAIPPELERHRRVLDRIAKIADDKWGPAACLQTGENEFTFFGWASS